MAMTAFFFSIHHLLTTSTPSPRKLTTTQRNGKGCKKKVYKRETQVRMVQRSGRMRYVRSLSHVTTQTQTSKTDTASQTDGKIDVQSCVQQYVRLLSIQTDTNKERMKKKLLCSQWRDSGEDNPNLIRMPQPCVTVYGMSDT